MAATQSWGCRPPIRSIDRTKQGTRHTNRGVIVAAAAAAATVSIAAAAADPHRAVVGEDRKDVPARTDATIHRREPIAEGFWEILAAVEEEQQQQQQEQEQEQQPGPSVVRTERMGCSARRRQRRNRWNDSGNHDGSSSSPMTTGKTKSLREVIVLTGHRASELPEDLSEI